MSNGETKELAIKRLTQVYRYIQALDQLQNPVRKSINEQPWVLWFRDLPEHPTVQRGKVDIVVDSDGSEVIQAGENFILKVNRPETRRAPEPPAEIADWLQNGWQSVDGKVVVYETIEETDEEGQNQIVRFEDDPIRTETLNIWTVSRDKWVEAERPARRAMSIFEKLYSLYAQLERESERVELVLGDGLLNWLHSEGGNVCHPILLQRLFLQFDPSVPEFTLVETDHPTELYTALLRTIPEVSALAIGHCREDMEQGGWHPLAEDETSEYFKRVATQLSPHGRFIGHESSKEERKVPLIGRDPVIFLRNRTMGFSAAIEAILKDIPLSEDKPAFLNNIVGIELQKNDLDDESRPADFNTNGEDEDILLSKEANAEQVQIARSLEKHGAVLVEGPPGTGKTHTIANLLSHFLSQGRSVLVTSHTAKALKVLREKVVEPLQPLCVSLMRDDSRSQMESAIDAITERLANSELDALERSAAALYRERLELLRHLREARQQLLLARQDEYRPVVVAGEEYLPSQAARRVAKGEKNMSWIPSPITLGAPIPLSPGELAELYRTNVLLTSEDEKELAYDLPDPEKLILPDEFAYLVNERSRLLKENLDYRRDLWADMPAHITPDAIQDLLERIMRLVSPLQEGPEWRLTAIAAGRNGGIHREPWDNLIKLIEEIYENVLRSKEVILQFGPAVPEDCLPGRIEQVIDDIFQYLNQGGKLGRWKLLMNREWKTLCEHARVNQQPPSELIHFKALHTLVYIKADRKKLIERWERQVAVLGGPAAVELGPEPEHACYQFCSFIKQSLDWHSSVWAALEDELVQIGFRWNAFLNEMPVNLSSNGELLKLRDAVLEKLPLVIEAHKNRLIINNIEARLRNLAGLLEISGGDEATAGLLQRLSVSVKKLDSREYQDSFRQLVGLNAKRELLKRRQDLLDKLERVAPSWATAIRDRDGLHGEREVPGDASEAWLWRQLNDELKERAHKSMEDLQGTIAQISESLRNITAKLVEKKAWAAQIRRTSLEQRQALHGWKLLMGRFGKGTGTRAPRLLAEARKLMPVCQTAVPVWIMPLSRVAENFEPGKNFFDVVIIDEASQADVMALVALYMGRQVIVVGDNKQVSPLAVGQKQDEVQKLIDEHLKDIPNNQLYDGLFSVYDLGMTAFKPVCLREHFRCVSPIIQFSNHLSYDGKIKPLRDDSDVLCRPYTVAYRVEGTTSRNGKINEKEALTIASLTVACTEQPEYKDASFGIISMLGDEQTILIDSLLQRYLPFSEYSRRRIQCGNSAQFQGDERDVIFLSLVDAANGEGTLTLRSEGHQNMYKKRLNVAASRARNQMWVVYSLNPDINLKPGDLRRRLIQHAKDPGALMRLLETQEERTESEFERLVMQRLIQAGYRVKAQRAVGAYRIDMVVEGGGKRLAVECDGDRWHTEENLKEDMARQMILERMGWRFVRIRGGQFFRNQDKAMEPVFERLKALEIPPEGPGAITDAIDSFDTELKERIISRAAEIRQEWEESGEEFYIRPSRKGKFKKLSNIQSRSSNKLSESLVNKETKVVKTLEERASKGNEKVSKTEKNF
ncbi:MAG: AAA domain-containing protein [Bacillota bacterium]